MQQIKQLLVTVVLLAALGSLAACSTTVSRGVAADGSGAEQLIWPDPDDVNAISTDGTWPTLASLRLIHAGMNKEQIIPLIGPPHYYAGAVGVQEWNYVFHLRDPQTGETRVCQYKILFDEEGIARSFYWHPSDCNPFRQAKVKQVLTFYTLFEFDKWGLDDMHPGGRKALREVVDDIKSWVAAGASITVKGFADPIGSEAYNLELSRKRAESVRDFLVRHGVPAGAIRAVGYGEGLSIAQCREADSRAARIACLQPERRVQIVIRRGGA